GATAALFIGDVALRPDLHPAISHRLDLGLEWWGETGLPFAFALWQTSSPQNATALRRLHADLLESREYGERERSCLSTRYASRFSMPPISLERYWSDLA